MLEGQRGDTQTDFLSSQGLQSWSRRKSKYTKCYQTVRGTEVETHSGGGGESVTEAGHEDPVLQAALQGTPKEIKDR